MMLDGARPRGERRSHQGGNWPLPPRGPDRLALARIDARLRSLALELVQGPPAPAGRAHGRDRIAPGRARRRRRPTGRDRRHPRRSGARLSQRPGQAQAGHGRGRTAAATVATFVNLGVRGVPRAQLHDPKRPALGRIVSVEASEYAERRGLAIALPTALEMKSSWWATLDSNQ